MSNPISFIPRIYKPSLVIPIEIDDVLNWIRTGLSIRQNLIQITTRIHNTSDHDSRSQLKYWNLPVALFNGEFSYKSKDRLVSYSSYTALDFDNFSSEEELCRVGSRLVNTPCVYAVFRTPSGIGLKALVMHDNTDPTLHDELFGQLLKMFQIDGIDSSVSDLARGNYICYDPNLWKNPKPVAFHFVHDPGYAPTAAPVSSPRNSYDLKMLRMMLGFRIVHGKKSDESIINILNAHWKKQPDRWVVGNRSNSIFKSASELCSAGVNIDKAINYLVKAYSDTGMDEERIVYQAFRGYQNNADNYGCSRSRFDGYGKSRK